MSTEPIPKTRCLILGCSRAKDPSPDPLPAIQRYNGPPFKVLRRYLNESSDAQQDLDIYVLSAKYGLIKGRELVSDYNRRMTNKRADELHPQIREKIQKRFSPLQYDEIFLSMGKTYLRALRDIEEQFNVSTKIIVSDSSAGKKLTELRNWLWKITPADDGDSRRPKRVTPNVEPQSVTLRGHTLTMTTEEAIEKLERGVEETSETAQKLRTWYVDVNGRRLSPKWAAQYLFKVSVKKFAADEARRVLRQLGLNCYKL